MRMTLHSVKTPTWTQSEYGEPTPAYGNASSISMKIGWNSMIDQDKNNALYKEYAFVGLTRANPAVGSLIDDTYIVGHVEPGRWNRVFMNYAEGKDRTYVEPSVEES